jgi:mRNA-degrading endonuclease RelE of RelBE toxin-antitoxin system
LRIEWHEEALDDLRKLGVPDQRRIKNIVDELLQLDDPAKNWCLIAAT